MSGQLSPSGWLLLDQDEVPLQWRKRGRLFVMVPLLPDETRRALAGDQVVPELTESDERLAHLVANGASFPEIARALAVSDRTAERRVARLCSRYGVSTKSELAAFLATKGFGGGGTAATS